MLKDVKSLYANSDGWGQIQKTISDVVGYGPSLSALSKGQVTLEYGVIRFEYLNFSYDINKGSTTPVEYTGTWAEENVWGPKTGLEKSLCRTIGFFKPASWRYSVIALGAYEARMGKGSHDPIPYPYVTFKFIPDDVLAAAYAVIQERIEMAVQPVAD